MQGGPAAELGVGVLSVWQGAAGAGEAVRLWGEAMSTKKYSTTVYLTEDQLDALDDLSRELRIPKAVMIRDGVAVAIKQYIKIRDAERGRRR